MLKEHDCPLFDFDETQYSGRVAQVTDVTLPKIAVMSYFPEVAEAFIAANGLKPVLELNHGYRKFQYYAIDHNGVPITFCLSPMGAPISVNVMEDLYANGVTTVITHGGCGVLDDIPAGKLLIPAKALRDEGTSYHYCRPSKWIESDKEMLRLAEAFLTERQLPYQLCSTWTTDASHRETADKIRLRKAQGCNTVEMECAALTACARFRRKRFIELLYSGDLLSNTAQYDTRDWMHNLSARELLFRISLDFAAYLAVL